VDLDMVNFGSGLVLCFDQRAYLSTGLGPRLNLRWVTPQEPRGGDHR
jgi:hypothetical protein